MKYSKSETRESKNQRIRILILFLLFLFSIPSYARGNELKLKAPIQENEQDENRPSQIDLSAIPNFPRFGASSNGRRISTNNNVIALTTPLKLSVDSFIDAKTAMIGDYFKAHVLEDYYISTDTPQLILPKGSWVRGRISSLKRPNFFTKTAKIGLHLDELVTPLGETLILDAELDVQKGLLDEKGFLRPTVIKQPSQQILPDSTVPVPISSLGLSLIDSLLTGKLYALFSQGDTTTLNKGQELQIVLQRNVQLTAN